MLRLGCMNCWLGNLVILNKKKLFMKIDPHGLFIGLVNLPLTQEESFNENFVENIFKSYSESLRNIKFSSSYNHAMYC